MTTTATAMMVKCVGGKGYGARRARARAAALAMMMMMMMMVLIATSVAAGVGRGMTRERSRMIRESAKAFGEGEETDRGADGGVARDFDGRVDAVDDDFGAAAAAEEEAAAAAAEEEETSRPLPPQALPAAPVEAATAAKIAEMNAALTIPWSVATSKYSVIIDAGSTGSRVHVFQFDAKDMRLQKDTFESIEPGLSAFANDANAAAESLKPLLDIAVGAVPESSRNDTQVQMRATAGLRLLPGETASEILAACATLLNSYPFSHDKDSISIMDGAREGAYQWLTMNYLSGNIGFTSGHAHAIKTVAAVDLGGGSVQLAYQVTAKEAREAPKGYVHKLKALGSTFDVYSQSHLGHGLMAARAAILSESHGDSPCVHGGHNGTYEYSGKKYDASSHVDGSDHELCAKLVISALNVDKPCEREGECSFNGAWGGEAGPGSKRVYLSSYLWDRAVNVGLVNPKNETDGQTSVEELEDKAKEACALSLNKVAKTYNAVKESDAPFLCMDLTFMHALLAVGFARHGFTNVTLVKRIASDNTPIEVAWPLGVALNSMA